MNKKIILKVIEVSKKFAKGKYEKMTKLMGVNIC